MSRRKPIVGAANPLLEATTMTPRGRRVLVRACLRESIRKVELAIASSPPGALLNPPDASYLQACHQLLAEHYAQSRDEVIDVVQELEEEHDEAQATLFPRER